MSQYSSMLAPCELTIIGDRSERDRIVPVFPGKRGKQGAKQKLKSMYGKCALPMYCGIKERTVLCLFAISIVAEG